MTSRQRDVLKGLIDKRSRELLAAQTFDAQCAECGDGFMFSRFNVHGTQKYCSRSCAGAARAARVRASRATA